MMRCSPEKKVCAEKLSGNCADERIVVRPNARSKKPRRLRARTLKRGVASPSGDPPLDT